MASDDHDDRTVVEALIAQIEFCDVIVINKTDLIDTDTLAKLRRVLHALNPRAELIDAHQGVVPASELLNTDRFDFDATSSAPGWLAMLNADPDSASELAADDLGVGGFVYRARRPFHPERLWALVHQEWPGVLRCKGFFWLATRSDIGGSLSQAGARCGMVPRACGGRRRSAASGRPAMRSWKLRLPRTGTVMRTI